MDFVIKASCDHNRDILIVHTTCSLSDEKVKTSKMEVSAVIHSLIECMKYVLSRYDSDGNTDCLLGDELLQEQVEEFIRLSV